MKYQTFWRRLLSGLIDGILLSLIPLLELVFAVHERPAWVAVIWVIVGWLSYSVYNVFFHWRYGQTLGKMVTGVTVLHDSEKRRPHLLEAILRDVGNIAYAIAMLCIQLPLMLKDEYVAGDEMKSMAWNPVLFIYASWITADALTLLRNDRRRALHDFIGRTVVVRNQSANGMSRA